MKFKVGQIIELINNDGMAAEVGATAIVKNVTSSCLGVVWKTKSRCQMDGFYMLSQFKPTSVKGQQFLFSFME